MPVEVQEESRIRLALGLIFFLILLVAFSANGGSFINDVNTDEAMYSPGKAVTIYVGLTNSTASDI